LSAALLATILYEDSRDGGNEDYPLHRLLLKWAALPDPSGFPHHSFHANPQRGVNKLLGTLQSRLTNHMGRCLIALVDEDRIREQMGLRSDLPLEQVREQLRLGSARPNDTKVYFLRANLEDLLGDLAHCAGLQTAEKATGKPRPNDRDILINRAKKAFHDSHFDCLAQRQDELKVLVSLLRSLLPAPKVA
jgi:hypothetical protein